MTKGSKMTKSYTMNHKYGQLKYWANGTVEIENNLFLDYDIGFFTKTMMGKPRFRLPVGWFHIPYELGIAFICVKI